MAHNNRPISAHLTIISSFDTNSQTSDKTNDDSIDCYNSDYSTSNMSVNDENRSKDCCEDKSRSNLDGSNDKMTMITITNSGSNPPSFIDLWQCASLRSRRCSHSDEHHKESWNHSENLSRDAASNHKYLSDSRSDTSTTISRIASAPNYIFSSDYDLTSKDVSNSQQLNHTSRRRVSIAGDIQCSRHHHRRNSTALKFDKPSYMS